MTGVEHRCDDDDADLSIAVIIPVRDRCQQVQQAVQSVLAQSRPPTQVIVVDDGSSDGSGELVSRNFPQVEVIRCSPGGVSHARNLGIAKATTAWVALLDSDDVWHVNKLQRQAEAIRADSGIRVVHCDEVWIRDGVRVNPMRKHAKRGGFIYRHCLPLCCMSPSAILIHTSVFEKVGCFDEAMVACEDYDLWLRIAARYPVHYVDEMLLTRYAGHADQLSATVPAQDRFRLMALDKMLTDEVLNDEDWIATLSCFASKVEIYANGAHRRGRIDEAKGWRDRLATLWQDPRALADRHGAANSASTASSSK